MISLNEEIHFRRREREQIAQLRFQIELAVFAATSARSLGDWLRAADDLILTALQ